ncbi:Unknown protein sequence [Pseudomonas syringae pv. maculicola]|nr:Unknown protein sequence [Pseudomonas syringae pv. maculicola]
MLWQQRFNSYRLAHQLCVPADAVQQPTFRPQCRGIGTIAWGWHTSCFTG